MIKIEYILPFDLKNNKCCSNKKSLKSLISTDPDFVIIDNTKIEYKGNRYNYKLKHYPIDENQLSVFHIEFETTEISDVFLEMLKNFKRIVGVYLQDKILLVWDDVSFEWLKDLYPKIFIVENLIRKLISKFMILTLGVNWFKTHIPEEVTNSIKKKKYVPSANILYEIDFIQLVNVLFLPYTIKPINKLSTVLGKIKAGKEIDNELEKEINEFIPKNNWDRYFAKIVKVQSEEIKKKLNDLYEIRNNIAHNRPISIDKYKRAIKLINEIRTSINKALINLDIIVMDEETKLAFKELSKSLIGTYNFVSNNMEHFAKKISLSINKNNDLNNLATYNWSELTKNIIKAIEEEE